MMDLDNIVNGEGIILQKQEMYNSLVTKDSALKYTDIAVLYTLSLDLDYQRKLVNIGMFSLYMDINKMSTVYKNAKENK